MFTVVIQAGGESRRMGRDKALLSFLGEPLIRRVLARVAPLADEVLITTNRPESYRFLGLPLFPDKLPGRGALGGLYTALSAAQYPVVGVVACDMPFMSPALLAAEREILLQPGAVAEKDHPASGEIDAVVPRTEGGTEPFHAVYRRATCLPAIEAALQADKWRVDAWFPSVQLYFLSPEETRRYDPNNLAFWNLNTPEEFRQAEEMASQMGQEP